MEDELASMIQIRWRPLLNATLRYHINDINYDDNNDTNRVQRPPYVISEDQQIYVYVTAPRYFRSLGKLLSRSSKRYISSVLYAYNICARIFRGTKLHI
jgi:hypothetical protein